MRPKEPITFTPDARAIGQRIRDTRKARGWTLAGLARVIGCTPGALATWECGCRVPSRDTLVKLSRALRRTMDWITTGRGARSSKDARSVGRGTLKVLKGGPEVSSGHRLSMTPRV